MKKTDLYFNQGSSNKEYHIMLEKKGAGYVVNFEYGRVGNALTSGTKTARPVSLGEAEKIYEKLYREKTAKGYEEKLDRKSTGYSQVDGSKPKKVIMLPQLLNTVDDAQKYIDDDEYIAQEKMDGERRGVVSKATVIGCNKKGTEVPLPLNVINALEGINCELDGEQVGDKLYVWDILNRNGQDLRGLPLSRRLEYLDLVNLLFANYTVVVVRTAYSKEQKQQLFDELKSRDAEGIVFKKKDSIYKAGRPNSAGPALKFKFNETATCRVHSLTEEKRSVMLEMLDGENWIKVGKVTIPPNKKVPDPGTLVEVRYLYAYKDGCLFQPAYLEKRNDCDDSDTAIKQLKYKVE